MAMTINPTQAPSNGTGSGTSFPTMGLGFPSMTNGAFPGVGATNGASPLSAVYSNINSLNSMANSNNAMTQEMSQMMTMMTTMMTMMMSRMMGGLSGGAGGVSPISGASSPTSSGTGSGTSGASGGGSSPSSSSSSSGSSSVGNVGDISNQSQFATAVLQALGDPTSSANISSLVDWEKREGGNWNNTAKYNPLNTTESEPGDSSMNSDGVKAYTSWQEGVQATVSTLQNGKYSDLLAALKSGSGLDSGSYSGLSTWSGGAYSSV